MYQTIQFIYTGKKIRLIKVYEFSYIKKCIGLIQNIPCKTQHKDKTRINSETGTSETPFPLQWALPTLTDSLSSLGEQLHCNYLIIKKIFFYKGFV